jgi:hypothetical protein
VKMARKVEGWGGGGHALGVCDGRCSSDVDGEGVGRGNIHSGLRGRVRRCQKRTSRDAENKDDAE